MRPVIAYSNLVTPYGKGMDPCWNGLMSSNTAITQIRRFNTTAFKSNQAAVVSSIDRENKESLAMQLVRESFADNLSNIPSDSFVILATTTGEIDLLERSILGEAVNADDSRINMMFDKVCALLSINGGGCVISAACASSTIALGYAASRIRDNLSSSVLVVACDSVNEFVYSGFSSLMALDAGPAKPFDRNRKGLTPGEAAAFTLIMSEERATSDGFDADIEIAGWGMSNDANHMTGPSRDGTALAIAIRKAFQTSQCKTNDISSICAHGTGTPYNDGMEMKAFKLIFDNQPIPVYSVKGGIGHTMGAAGLVESLIAVRSLQECIAPPTVGLDHVDDMASGWVSPEAVVTRNTGMVLTTNSGFGGVNAALVLKQL
ncbi:MAG: beta-ketoacyl-[acyl-carrier-protein] synthase family protein [Lentisphaerae bacterium]|nr:beta-ketoacyl-[acyl-carrier-protein] synthase family protein [Lentisphaerota bacterium]